MGTETRSLKGSAFGLGGPETRHALHGAVPFAAAVLTERDVPLLNEFRCIHVLILVFLGVEDAQLVLLEVDLERTRRGACASQAQPLVFSLALFCACVLQTHAIPTSSTTPGYQFPSSGQNKKTWAIGLGTACRWNEGSFARVS